MWRQIRGQGLAYSFSISVSVEHGLLYFALRKATHLAEAFKEAVNITRAHLNGRATVEGCGRLEAGQLFH